MTSREASTSSVAPVAEDGVISKEVAADKSKRFRIRRRFREMVIRHQGCWSKVQWIFDNERNTASVIMLNLSIPAYVHCHGEVSA